MTFFKNVGSFIGKVLLRVVGVVHAADHAIDADAAKIEEVLQKGESIATLIPGIGPEVAGFLNVGLDLFGAVKTGLDETDSELQKLVATIQPQLQAGGVSALLVPTEILATAKKLLADYEAEVAAAKISIAAGPQSAAEAIAASTPAPAHQPQGQQMQP